MIRQSCNKLPLFYLLAFITMSHYVRAADAPSFHDRMKWKADEFFKDEKVIALCKAIEKNDLQEIDRLVAAGADVNAVGKEGMTPLLWSFFDNKLERFTKLLEHGANPNVFTTGDFGTMGAMGKGKSITHMACKTAFPGYFDAVFKHGGDTNLVARDVVGNQGTPLFTVICGEGNDKLERVRKLIELGANVNALDVNKKNAAQRAITWGDRCDLALLIFEAGADPKNVASENRTTAYTMIRARQSGEKFWSAKQKEDYIKLVAWLAKQGITLDEAERRVEEEDKPR